MTERSEHCQNIVMRILQSRFFFSFFFFLIFNPNLFYLDRVLKNSLVEELNLGFQFEILRGNSFYFLV